MKHNKNNLLHVVNIFFVIPYFLGNQLRYFKEKGYHEHIICSPSDELEAYSRMQGFDYEEIPINRAISLRDDLKALFKTMRYIRRHHIGVVTGHTPKGGIIAMAAAWLTRVPTRIYFRHGLVYETSSGMKRRLLITIDRLASAMATRVVCVSNSVGKRAMEDKLDRAGKQTLLNHGTCNGIDTRRFNRNAVSTTEVSELRNRLGINEGDFVVGYVGRLVRDKGIIELTEAINALHSRHPNLKLMLVGMYETRDALPQSTVDLIQSHPAIIHTGYVDYHTIENYYALMSALILPSYREGFPTSVIEASAMSIPVLTTRATGCIDSIIEGETGLFIDHSAENIASAIERLINSPELCMALGEGGHRLAVEQYDERVVWQHIERLYNH